MPGLRWLAMVSELWQYDAGFSLLRLHRFDDFWTGIILLQFWNYVDVAWFSVKIKVLILLVVHFTGKYGKCFNTLKACFQVLMVDFQFLGNFFVAGQFGFLQLVSLVFCNITSFSDQLTSLLMLKHTDIFSRTDGNITNLDFGSVTIFWQYS